MRNLQGQVPQYIRDAYLYLTKGLDSVPMPTECDRPGWAMYETDVGVKWDGVPVMVCAKLESSIYIIQTIHGRQFGVAIEDFEVLWPRKEVNGEWVDYMEPERDPYWDKEIIYAHENGVGDGKSTETPCNFVAALKRINSGEQVTVCLVGE